MPSTPSESNAAPPLSSLAIEAKGGPPRTARIWSHALAAGVVAGVVSWLAGEACLDVVKARRRAVVDRGMALNISDRQGEAAAGALNAGLAFALLGASLGAAFGAAGGCIRGDGRAAGRAAGVGLAVGAVGAAMASAAVLPTYNAYRLGHPDEASRDLMLPLAVHVVTWATAGAAGGLALGAGLGLRDRRALSRLVVGGLGGAALGAVIFELAGAIAFPEAETARYVSKTAPTRLLARLLVCILAAGGAAAAAVDALRLDHDEARPGGDVPEDVHTS
jgi:hypothetical protein